MEHTFKYAVIGGILYLIVWMIYRLFRHDEHKKLIKIHRDERLKRAHHEYNNNQNKLDLEELIRRAEWDSTYGHLMSTIEIKNREESRWPVGNAIQGLASFVSGIFVATLIWDSFSGISNNAIISQQTVESRSTNTAHDFLPINYFDSVFPLSLVLIISGVIFWKLSNKYIGRFIGGSLILTASVLSGLKILNIEELISIKEITGIKLQTESIINDNNPTIYSLSISVPAFPTASTTPTPQMLCAIKKVGTELSIKNGVFLVNVLGGADKRELTPKTKAIFSSNWALAQQRGIAVQQILAPYIPVGVGLQVSNYGPKNTTLNSDTSLLELDRVPSIQLTGVGIPPENITKLQNISWSSECNYSTQTHNNHNSGGGAGFE